MNNRHLDRAVAPNLFDVVVEPELVFTLVLANLMSSRLWELRERLLRPAGTADAPDEGNAQRIQQMLDHHFEHVTPARVAEMNGVFDLDALAARYGAAAVDDAMGGIVSTFERRVANGTRDRHTLALDLIAQRKFPAYAYATIDEAWACRRLLQRRKHKPWGLTCCLDEAALFAALHLALTGGSPADVVIIGAPTHYSVLVDTAEGAYWFYTKQELHSRSTWFRLVADSCAGNGQAAFDERLPTFDRIITASGCYWLGRGESSMHDADLAAIVARIDSFFGCRLAQLDRALRRPVRHVHGSSAVDVIAHALAASSAAEVRKRVHLAAHEEGNLSSLRALYAFRTLDVPELSVYLQAARDNSQIAEFLPAIGATDDAIRFVAAIPGSASIFEDPDRIAMPDETARFATGSDRDKALLLHVLLERAGDLNEGVKGSLETLACEADSFVRSAQFCISLSRMARVTAAEGRILYRIAGSACQMRL